MENITETNEEKIYNVVDEYVSKIDGLYGDFSYNAFLIKLENINPNDPVTKHFNLFCFIIFLLSNQIIFSIICI
jgi:hypothetical protein